MLEIINEKANDYATSYSEPTDKLLQEIEEFTLNHHAHSNMLSGPLQGKLLEMLSKIIKPKFILEIGTFTGYSALCLAKGLRENGFLHTIELREEDATISQNYFAKSSQSEQIILHRGNALDIIPQLKEEWDLVFIDADKTNYINYYELTLQQLKKGGIILADNVLFHGDVLKETISGKNAIAINNFNEHVAKDDRVQQVILTVRDGLMMILKK
ncbi:MAG TPA: O-methyltransferase [Hanamia sp.]|jgi:predicted O-methyltransferase YrrM|nr:O-methyltransferase [Hanamia sp.]